MGVDLNGMAVLIAITTILTLSMLIGWRNFGRMPYALCWAFAAGGEALQWVINAAASSMPSASPLGLFVTGLLTIVDSALVVIGFYNRSARPTPARWLFAGGAGMALVIGWAMFANSPPDIALRSAAANLYACAMFVIAAGAVRPHGRPANIPEIAAIGGALLFATYQLILTVAWLGAGTGRLASTLLVVGLPVAYVCTGITAMLLVASDLYGRLEAQATRDPLTGALNRRGLEQSIVPALANARRRRQPLSLVVIDVGAVPPGRALGRHAQERMLVTAADTLNAAIREEDVFAHLGDGEFCVALIETSAEEAAAVADRMGEAFDALDIPGLPDIRVVPAFGIAQVQTEDMSVGSPIRRAQERMFEARLSLRAAQAMSVYDGI